MLKEAYLALAILVSGGHEEVSRDVTLYFDEPNSYFDRFKVDLEDSRGITSLSKLQEKPVMVLTDALERHGFLFFMDWKDDLELYLEHKDIQSLSNNALASSLCLKKLQGADPNEYHSITKLLEQPERIRQHAILNCIAAEGFLLADINEDNDSHQIVLIPTKSKALLARLAGNANIEILFLSAE
jgi:hypothetical protein